MHGAMMKKGLKITQHSFYETLWGEFDQTAKRLMCHLKTIITQV